MTLWSFLFDHHSFFFMPKIVNLVVTAALGRHVNLRGLANRFPQKVRYDPEGALIWVDRKVKIRLFRTGKMVMFGAQRSLATAKHHLMRTMVELGFRRPRNITVVNMVATWTLAPRDATERHQVNGAFVQVTPAGKVFCTGVKNRPELKRVFEAIQ